ncbi:MAG: hypothetical protein Q8L30_01205 [bacterium]|nr:hypothetical protein [bacterium]
MNNKKLGFLPEYTSWLTIALAIIAIVTFLVISNPSVGYPVPMGVRESSNGSAVPMMDTGVSSPGRMMSPDIYPYQYPYPYPNPEVPVTDTREFLKIYYNASMRTRDVPTLTRRVETTVRGYDGRIDNESSAEKYGYVSFALPQSKYDAFRTELESLVGSRFLKVNISSQNLLSQKVSIEEQQKQADKTLADYKTDRAKIVNAHTAAVQSLQAKIDATTATSSERASLEQQLSRENASYTRNLSNADANIKYAQDWVKGVQTQDATLLANVATVTGTVSVQWISLSDIVLLYLPGYWIPTIFAVLALLSFYRDRARARKY